MIAKGAYYGRGKLTRFGAMQAAWRAYRKGYPMNTRTVTVGDFGTALKALREGHAVTRHGWNGRGMWLRLQVPDEHSKMSLPYIYMHTAQGERVPWVASQTDLLGSDWRTVEGD